MSRTYKHRYGNAKRIDRTCRNNGGCPFCRDNRLYNDRKRRQAAEQAIADYWRGVEIVAIESYEREKPEPLFFVGDYR